MGIRLKFRLPVQAQASPSRKGRMRNPLQELK